MIDYDLVRAYYFAPPPRDPERVPSDEELLARYERRLVEDCILRLGDPEAEGLGPHGSMIGGPGKPTTIHYCRAERTTPISPLPLSWWDYPRARERPQPPGGQPAAHAYLDDLSGIHLAGIANRPSGRSLARLFRSPRPSAADRDTLAHLFGAVTATRFNRLTTLGGISLYELARALHAAGTRRADLVRWINQFAVPPSRRG